MLLKKTPIVPALHNILCILAQRIWFYWYWRSIHSCLSPLDTMSSQANISDDLPRSPLPTKVLLLLLPICLFHDMDITMVFSYAPKLIQSFGVSEVSTGYYAGILGSSMYVGFLFCSLPWSHFGDIKGKKLSCIISSSLLVVNMFLFGFSWTFAWAVLTRFLQGNAVFPTKY